MKKIELTQLNTFDFIGVYTGGYVLPMISPKKKGMFVLFVVLLAGQVSNFGLHTNYSLIAFMEGKYL